MIRFGYALGTGVRILVLGVLLFLVVMLLLDASGGAATVFRYERY